MSRRQVVFLAVVVIFVAVGLVTRHIRRKIRNRPFILSGAVLTDYAALEPIDAHTHVFQTDPQLVQLLQRLHMHVLDILYIDDTTPSMNALAPERSAAMDFVKESAGHAELCTTFDPYTFRNKNFSRNAIAGLDQDFSNGAVAAKVWKNVGMELLNRSGKYVMPDDPVFEPIYQDIAARGKTLLIHAAEPDEAWGLNPPGSYIKYYLQDPQWNMAQKADAPAKETILEARDDIMAKNPGLRVVGAHFGSMEDHLDEVAQRLDRYPNFAVDTAARIRRLTFQPRDKVRSFIMKYQDRILYGTDLNIYANNANPSAAVESWQKQYARDWRYLSTHDIFQYEGHRTEGLDLPRSVLKKLYHDNAVHWYPGIVAPAQ